MSGFFSVLLLAVVLIPLQVMAALPPGAESLRRIKAIAESPEVFDRIGSADWVTGIKEGKDSHYIVTTKRCTLNVQINTTPLSQEEPKLVGPDKLQVVVGSIKCSRRN